MTSQPTENAQVESEEEMKQREEAKHIRAALDGHHKKWYNNIAFFIITLVFAAVSFIGGYFVRRDFLVDSVLQSIVFVITVGFFALPLTWLFNQLWKVFLKK